MCMIRAKARLPSRVVFDTWPSGGLFLHGLEVKISAGDLRRELQDTTKSGDFCEHLDFFSIVAPAGIVKLDMLPEHWGLYCPMENGTLRAKRKPLMLKDGRNPGDIKRPFAAAFCRALVTRSLSKEAEKAAFAQGKKDGEYWMERRAKEAEADAKRAKEAIAEFEQVSGVHIDGYRGRKIGEAVEFVLRGGLDTKLGYAPDLHKLAANLEAVACEMDRLKEATAPQLVMPL